MFYFYALFPTLNKLHIFGDQSEKGETIKFDYSWWKAPLIAFRWLHNIM